MTTQITPEQAREIARQLIDRTLSGIDPHPVEALRSLADQVEALTAELDACAKAADDQWVKNPNVSGGDAIRARNKQELLK